MNALDVIRRVEVLGGSLVLDGHQLRLRASHALPDDVVTAVGEQKAAIMVALGAPIDTVVGAILHEMRPQLPEGLRKLPDDRLLVLVNWSIIAAWEKTVQKFGSGGR